MTKPPEWGFEIVYKPDDELLALMQLKEGMVWPNAGRLVQLRINNLVMKQDTFMALTVEQLKQHMEHCRMMLEYLKVIDE